MTIIMFLPHLVWEPRQNSHYRVVEFVYVTGCERIHVNLLWLTNADSLIQQTGCDPVTPGCQGDSGGAMAAGATVGESQLQRIIRDLHGTPNFVCM